jgi:hypothetical protein
VIDSLSLKLVPCGTPVFEVSNFKTKGSLQVVVPCAILAASTAFRVVV